MITRTFQAIYDFCHQDSTYRLYHELDRTKFNRRQNRYYENDLHSHRPVSRLGTYIYGAGQTALRRFFHIWQWNREEVERMAIRIHIDLRRRCKADVPDVYSQDIVYVCATIEAAGVRIHFDHPFDSPFTVDRQFVCYVARSHRPFTEEGLTEEVCHYFNRYLLYPPGRYRDLQLAYHIRKDRFPAWYRQYRINRHEQAEQEHYDMIERYSHPSQPVTYDEARNLLAATGALYDFCSDEYEQNEMIEDFLQLYG